MDNDETLRRYEAMSEDEKIYHANLILSAAPSDPRDWSDECVGVSSLLAGWSLARRDYLSASREWDRLFLYVVSQCGIGDEKDVISAAYNAGLMHWYLEDSLGVMSVTKPVYDYWINEKIPTPRSQRRLAKIVWLYAASGRPREASRLNKRVILGSLRHGRPLRFVRSLLYQVFLGVGLYGLAGKPELEGRMLRPKGLG